jgi:hypothetical protein
MLLCNRKKGMKHVNIFLIILSFGTQNYCQETTLKSSKSTSGFIVGAVATAAACVVGIMGYLYSQKPEYKFCRRLTETPLDVELRTLLEQQLNPNQRIWMYDPSLGQIYVSPIEYAFKKNASDHIIRSLILSGATTDTIDEQYHVKFNHIASQAHNTEKLFSLLNAWEANVSTDDINALIAQVDPTSKGWLEIDDQLINQENVSLLKCAIHKKLPEPVIIKLLNRRIESDELTQEEQQYFKEILFSYQERRIVPYQFSGLHGQAHSQPCNLL